MKKLASIILSAVIAFSAFNFVYADDTGYTEILEGIKLIIDIPEYDNFSYNVLSDGEYYEFSWSNENVRDILTITADKDLNITSYFRNYDENSHETTLDITQAQSVADEFLKKVSGDCYKYYKINNDNVERNLTYIGYVYDIYIDGYKVKNESAKVEVSLIDGTVLNYRSEFLHRNKYISSEKPVSVEAVKKALFDNDNLTLTYEIVREDGLYEDNKVILKPLYRFKNTYVNAYTGKLRGEDEDDENAASSASGAAVNEMAVTEDADNGSVGKFSLTDTEKKEIDNLENAVKPEEAAKLIADKFKINISADNLRCEYFKNDNNDGYNLRFTNNDNVKDMYFGGTITPDKSFTEFYYNDDKNNILSGLKNIENYVKGIYPAADVPNDIKTNKHTYNDSNYYYYSFYDKHNGVNDSSNYVVLGFDENYNVKSVNYRKSNLEYEEFSRELTNDEIFDLATEVYSFEPFYYYNNKDKKYELYYSFNGTFSIDAATQKVVTYYGQKISNDFSSYTDVENTWYGEIANTLIGYGYQFDSNKFEGNKIVTGKDVIQFFAHTDVAKFKQWDASLREKYNEYAENPDKNVTKYDLANIIVDKLNLKTLAEKAEFVKPFEDVNDENIANVAICKAYDIVKGDNGKFNGDKPITRAEMAAMVYNFINIKR